MINQTGKTPLGIYIHIPFCVSKCSYCDFYSFKAGENEFDSYKQAVENSVRQWSQKCKDYIVDTVYFGGGTPSLMGGNRINDILKCLHESFDIRKDAEITVECNPDSMSDDLLSHLLSGGVNRLSVGVQSMDNQMLEKLSRRHTAEQATSAVIRAKQHGFDNISLDLMYALPDQTMDMLKHTLDKMLELEPKHMSCYALKVEQGTPFARQNINLPDEDLSADMYEEICKTLSQSGYKHYEISNWCKSGFKSRHNSRYWDLSEYLGIGCSAHSLFKGKRFEYKSDINSFLNGESPVYEESIEGFNEAEEFIMLSLRTDKGINRQNYTNRFGKDFDIIQNTIKKYEPYGFCDIEKDRVKLTEKGFLVSNVILSDILMSIE